MFVIDRLVPHLSNFLLFTWRLLAIFSCVICRGGNQTEPGHISEPFWGVSFRSATWPSRDQELCILSCPFLVDSATDAELSTTAWWTPTTSQHRGDVTFDVTLNSFHTGFSSHLPAQLNLVGVWRWWRMVHILKYEKIVCHAIEIRKNCAKTHWRWGRS